MKRKHVFFSTLAVLIASVWWLERRRYGAIAYQRGSNDKALEGM